MQPQTDTSPVVHTLLGHCCGFIDRETYASLKESRKALSIDKFKDLCFEDNEACKHLSASSRTYLKLLNDRINYALFGYAKGVRSSGMLDEQYLDAQLVAYLNEAPEREDAFYEILPVDHENFLVVVGSGFLYHLTQSKDAAVAYVLACLSCIDRFNCASPQLNELYLRLLYFPGYHLLIQARVQS